MTSPSTTLDTPAGSLTEELGALVDGFMSGVTDRIGRLAECGTNVELIDAVQSVERAVRSAEEAAARVVSAVETRGLYQFDGHHDAKAWMRAAVRTVPEEVSRRHRIGRLGREYPQVAAALARGEISVGYANKLAQTWQNPRVHHEFPYKVDAFVVMAAFMPYHEFCDYIDNWMRLTDEEGGHRERNTSHDSRDFRFLEAGELTLLRGQLGGIQAEITQQIFQAFVDCEWRYDVDEAKACLGVDAVSEADLARTPAQRRGDAIMKLFEAAACAPLNGSMIKVTVDIVIDQETFEEQLLAMIDPLHQRRGEVTLPFSVEAPEGSSGPTRDEHLAGIRLQLWSDDLADAAGEDGADVNADGEGDGTDPPTEAEGWIAAAMAAALADAERVGKVALRI